MHPSDDRNINIKLDGRQLELLKIFEQIAGEIKPNNFASRFKRLFSAGGHIRGIYLHGSVGRGKTLLMNMFYDQISLPKEMIHFQKFMQDVHTKMHQLQSASTNRVVQDLAADIASRAQVICMDEFEIKDISDAMIIMRLFKYLAKKNVFIFLTTNTLPDNLYKDGLQRESFLPFISMLKRHFQILHLDTEKDYRYNAVSHFENRVLYPASRETAQEIQGIKEKLSEQAVFSKTDLSVFGRDISFNQAHQNILFTNFKELFERDLGYVDYVNICENFEIIVLESVRKIEEDEQDIITRFINFIDNAYFCRILLFIEIKCKPEEIYPRGRKTAEFERTISRLNEMNTKNYLQREIS